MMDGRIDRWTDGLGTGFLHGSETKVEIPQSLSLLFFIPHFIQQEARERLRKIHPGNWNGESLREEKRRPQVRTREEEVRTLALKRRSRQLPRKPCAAAAGAGQTAWPLHLRPCRRDAAAAHFPDPPPTRTPPRTLPGTRAGGGGGVEWGSPGAGSGSRPSTATWPAAQWQPHPI